MTNINKITDVIAGHRTSSSTQLSPHKYHCHNRYSHVFCPFLTLGPKTNTVEMIAKLRKAGMNIVRMNFSHGSYEVGPASTYVNME